MRQVILQISEGTKQKDGMTVLRDFYLNIEEQSIILIAGGSVLEMSCVQQLLSGLDSFTSANLWIGREKILNARQMQALHSQIHVLSDKNKMLSTVSIVDNFFLCNNERLPFFAEDRNNSLILKEIMQRFSIDIDLTARADSLDLLQQYQIQLLKQYYLGHKVILLDKRNISLADEEFQKLCMLMVQLKKTGMTFLVLAYQLPSCWDMYDTVVIIHDGTTILHKQTSQFTEEQRGIILKESALREHYAVGTEKGEDEQAVFQLRDVNSEYLYNINLQLRKGEIAAIYYLYYDAAQELYQILSGDRRCTSGEICICGKRSKAKNRQQRVREGVALIEEFGQDTYLFENMTVLENYCLPKGLKFGRLWNNPRYMKHLKKTLNEQIGRNVADLPVRDLSPKEKLTVKFYAQMLSRPSVLICSDPFSSVDHQMKELVKKLLADVARRGIAILLLSRFETIQEINYYTQYRLDGEGVLERIYLEEDAVSDWHDPSR